MQWKPGCWCLWLPLSGTLSWMIIFVTYYISTFLFALVFSSLRMTISSSIFEGYSLINIAAYNWSSFWGDITCTRHRLLHFIVYYHKIWLHFVFAAKVCYSSVIIIIRHRRLHQELIPGNTEIEFLMKFIMSCVTLPMTSPFGSRGKVGYNNLFLLPY